MFGALAIASAALPFTGGCASRPAPRHFLAAGEEQSAGAIAAWKTAVARAEEMGPSRILYDVKIRQGIASASGTLALVTSPAVRGELTGEFGTKLAEYADGVLRGEKLQPVAIEPEPLLWLLAGVWRSGTPRVAGVAGEDALLVWDTGARAEGVIHVSDGRFVSIRAERTEGAIEATYAGVASPWPAQVALTDLRSGNTMRLVLKGTERLP